MHSSNGNVKFLEPWYPIESNNEMFVRELYNEICKDHILYGIKVKAIVRRHDCDDVLFMLLNLVPQGLKRGEYIQMTSEELLALIKSGKNEFYELDIEGIFINENLSNLFFEKCFFVADFSGANLTKTEFDGCNLKTCDFSYCNLEGSIFENNCLDATEFKFVQFKNMTFKNNSAYGCEFTKELLEDMQYDNYPGFHISAIKAGWFDVILSDRAKTIIVTASDYLCNDAPYEFLVAINDLCADNSDDISKTRWLCWDEEPGASIWKLERQNKRITIGVYTAKRDSYDIGPEERAHLEKEEIYCTDFETTGDFLGFAKEVAESYEKIKSLKKEDKNYEKQWGGFPDIELSKLKSYIQTAKQ